MSTNSDRPVRVAVVGLGYWGPNLARNLQRIDRCTLAVCCDLDEANHARFRSAFPSARFTTRIDEVLADGTIDAVCVATGAATHAVIARRVIDAGKHVFVEKPLALTGLDAKMLVDHAAQAGRVLVVGHLLRFHPGFRKVEQLVASGQLGRVLYLYANRLNFGRVRQDENALWSLGPHDLSLALALAGEPPVEVSARGACYLQPGIEDVVFCYLRFASGVTAHLHLSWLDPHKRRMLTVVGTERMVVFDDTESDRKVTVYEKTSWPKRFETWGEFQALQSGDIHIPRIDSVEPLAVQMQAFVDAVRAGRAVVATGEEGRAVVEVLEALAASLRAGGAPVTLAGAAS